MSGVIKSLRAWVPMFGSVNILWCFQLCYICIGWCRYL